MIPTARRTPLVTARFAPFALGLLATGSCLRVSGEDSKRPDAELERRKPARVRIAAVERAEMVRTISTTTVVESEKEIRVVPRVSGVVAEIHAEEGDEVAEGAVLAVLDERGAQSALAEARVALDEARDNVRKSDVLLKEAEARVETTRLEHEKASRDFERNEKAALLSAQALEQMRLVKDTAWSQHESARLGVERARIEAEASRTTEGRADLARARAELELSYTRITAPFAGVIASRSIRIGDSVGSAAPAFVLTDVGNLRAVFHRPQRELTLFLEAEERRGSPGNGAPAPGDAGLEIRASAEALPGARFRGEVLHLSPSIDAASGSFRVTVRLVAAEPLAGGRRLLPGMLVRLEVVTDRHPDALAVPKRALRREGEGVFLFVVKEGVARRVDVTEGFADDERVEVVPATAGTLVEGDAVVVVGNRDLEDGAQVETESRER